MFIEIPNFLDKNEIEYLRTNLRNFDKEKGELSDYQNREGLTIQITKSTDPQLKMIDTVLFEIFNKICNDVVIPNYSPSYKIADSGYEYHCYGPNQICKLHADGEFIKTMGVHEKSFLRFASVTLHLTTNTNGGDVIFPKQEKRFKTEAGKLLVWPPYGNYTHYTEPSTEEREIIVSWLLYDGISVVSTDRYT
jgi:hypothetical protein